MSDYLVAQLGATPNVEVRVRARVVDGQRDTQLTVEDVRTGRRERAAAAAVFVLIGAEPRTAWLRGTVEVDDRGFVPDGRASLPGRVAAPTGAAGLRDEPARRARGRRRAARLGQAGGERGRRGIGRGGLGPPVPGEVGAGAGTPR